ncbi:MAG: TonB-dependent receptor [Pseudomonadota bacterium]
MRVVLAAMLSYALLTPSLTLSAESAQSAQPAAAKDGAKADEEELEEVSITGTRIQTPGNNTSANPINTITGEEMRQLGIVNVGDALQQLVPQNISTYMPTLVGDDQAGSGGAGIEGLDRSSFFIGNTIANLRGLDPAFGSRTLTLVDGRRMVSTSNQADVVDLNIIPSNLLQRMDVVTGGASATYGSGAMAGVVNLVLNNRLTGFQLDMDYGINEAGDGASPHISASGGLPLFGGRAHALLGAEWQKTAAIQSCGDARAWCRESRALFNNFLPGTSNDLGAPLVPLDGFAGYPAHFETANVRYSQWGGDTADEYANGTVFHNNVALTSGFRMTEDGTGIVEYPYGLRGGASAASTSSAPATAINGDGPVTTAGVPMRPAQDRKTFFGNFEFNITERTTAYAQANYAKTVAVNNNRFTLSNQCVRFNTPTAAGTNVGIGTVYFSSATASNGNSNGVPYPLATQLRSAAFNQLDAGFLAFIGAPGASPFTNLTNYTTGSGFRNDTSNSAASTPFTPVNPVNVNSTAGTAVNTGRGVAYPFWMPVDLMPGGPPTFAFNNKAVGKWVRFSFWEDRSTNAWGVVDPSGTHVDAAGRRVTPGTFYTPHYRNDFWLLDSITLLEPYDLGNPPTLASLGRNAYAFLNTLEPEALNRLQNSTNNGLGAGSGSGVDLLYNATPCSGSTAIRKIWNPQVAQVTTQTSETMRVVAGVKGRFGRDWRWDTSYSWGKTDSLSEQSDVQTNVRMAFAMDAVVDDRGPTILDTRQTVNGAANPTFNQMIANPTNGQPVCRVVRDGPPVLDSTGRPLSDKAGLAQLASQCQPINIFGQTYANSSTVFPGGYDPAATQQAALDYAFVENSQSGGENSLQTLSFSVNGTLWQGWGAGPLTSAWGVEARKDTASQNGTQGSLWERFDLARVWADAFGGSTTVTEGFSELNMPLVSGQPGVNLWSLNMGGRYSSYHNKGGAGTAVDEDGNHLKSTQNVFNWKFQTIFEPFDWVRFRLSRSRDLRTAGYRDLFINQPGIQDSAQVRNPWRERTANSNENQAERYTPIRVGNPDLKPESSDTLTLGLVLSPNGWAQGMRFSVDYYDIHVKNGIGVSNRASNPVTDCFIDSGGVTPVFDSESGVMSNLAEYEAWRNSPNNFNANSDACQELQFASNDDGSVNLQDLLSYNSGRPSNLLPYQRRGMDLSLSYLFPLSRAFESLPGNISLTVRATRALEASGVMLNSNAAGFYTNPDGTPDVGLNRKTPNPNACGAKYDAADPENNTPASITTGQVQRLFPDGFYTNRYTCIDLVGQIRSNTFVPGITATPAWAGNITATYLLGDLTASLSARYVGGAKLDNTWGDSVDDLNYQNAAGKLLYGSVDNNTVKPYLNYSLNGSYNLKVADMKQFQVFGSINNLFDKSPPFTGGGISGASSQYHDTMGRAYRMGVRLKF